MTVRAVEGPAGSGKTCRLMEMLVDELHADPLLDGQRVLGLTYMHGARRRLETRLYSVAALCRRFECLTIDSFAWRVLNRWRALARHLNGDPPEAFDARCDLAGALLERPEVCAWVSGRFPIIVIDEAQDLRPQRLRMVRALEARARLLVAADEFQCLDMTLRPNPFMAWVRTACAPEVLAHIHRTDVPALLTAAARVRVGDSIVGGRGVALLSALGVPIAAANLANAIAWRNGGDVAVITPSLQGGFARNVVQRVTRQPCGARRNGPFPIHWERSDNDEHTALMQILELPEVASTADTLTRLQRLTPPGLVRTLCEWVSYQVRATGRAEFQSTEIESLIARQVALRKQWGAGDEHQFVAMTVQQAKNREFSGVVLIWPYQVGGDADHRRRLLYNALTRARRWCTIVVQNREILESAPFR